jgi:lysophospholipase L1-like esterase
MIFSAQSPASAQEAAPGRHVATTPAHRLQERGWKERHERFNKISQEGKAEVVFLGDSITQGWEGAGKAVWEEHFADLNAANFGISGDRTEHVLWRLANGNFDGLSPQLIVIMIGTNNIGHGSSTPEQAADGVRAIVENLHAKMPEAKLLLLGVFPRGEKAEDDLRQKTVEINGRIEKLDELDYVKYVDIGAKFLEDDGTLSKEIMPDFLHLSEDGYRRWAEAIAPHVKELLASISDRSGGTEE